MLTPRQVRAAFGEVSQRPSDFDRPVFDFFEGIGLRTIDCGGGQAAARLLRVLLGEVYVGLEAQTSVWDLHRESVLRHSKVLGECALAKVVIMDF